MTAPQLEKRIQICDSLATVFILLVVIGLVGEAGFSFWSWIVVVGVAGEFVLHIWQSRYSKRLTELQAAEADRLLFQIAEANKVAAEANLSRAQLEAKLSPRVLPVEKFNALVEELKPMAPKNLDIVVCENSAEAGLFARQILMATTLAGWSARLWNASGRVIGGLSIQLSIVPTIAENQPATSGLVLALKSIGIDANISGYFSPNEKFGPVELPPNEPGPEWDDKNCAPIRLLVGVKMEAVDAERHNAIWMKYLIERKNQAITQKG